MKTLLFFFRDGLHWVLAFQKLHVILNKSTFSKRKYHLMLFTIQTLKHDVDEVLSFNELEPLTFISLQNVALILPALLAVCLRVYLWVEHHNDLVLIAKIRCLSNISEV